MIHYINHSGLRNKQLTQQPTITTRYKIIFMGFGASTSPCVWSSHFKSIIFTLFCSAHWFRFTSCKLGEINLMIWSEFTFSFIYLNFCRVEHIFYWFCIIFWCSFPSCTILHTLLGTNLIISVETIQIFKGSLTNLSVNLIYGFPLYKYDIIVNSSC